MKNNKEVFWKNYFNNKCDLSNFERFLAGDDDNIVKVEYVLHGEKIIYVNNIDKKYKYFRIIEKTCLFTPVIVAVLAYILKSYLLMNITLGMVFVAGILILKFNVTIIDSKYYVPYKADEIPGNTKVYLYVVLIETHRYETDSYELEGNKIYFTNEQGNTVIGFNPIIIQIKKEK